ncbi:hypothetical protein [Thaumasiovibrio subtropicus]|uniref:hypothetical protein n=1 Tax=Thaumasiovibrio subtropicus TaxID=1891207 RepID=UPI000B3614BA|nr:hypothetical protein [Thaumasiovibrio subtropicus]
MKTLIVIMACMLILGCATPYDPIKDSYRSEYESLGIEPIYEDGKQNVLVMLHGMCEHNDGWANKKVAALAEAMSANIVKSDSDNLLFDEYKLVRGSYSLKVFALKVRNGLFPDEPVEAYNLKTAYLNKEVKDKLVSECLADVIAYASPWYGDTMKSQMSSSLNMIAESVLNDELDNVYLISESLGSTILRDALVCGKQTEIAEKLLGKVEAFYLSSNQLPLLDYLGTCRRGDIIRSSNEFRTDFAGVKKEELEERRTLDVPSSMEIIALNINRYKNIDVRKNEIKENVKIISFSDPNDLLSYQLRSDVFSKGDYPFLSIPVSNGRTWLWLYSDPVNTHKGYFKNNSVLNIMACGNNVCD